MLVVAAVTIREPMAPVVILPAAVDVVAASAAVAVEACCP